MRGDSAEVMQLLLTARFDAVLLDNWMPKINGIELRRLIRSLDKNFRFSSAPAQLQRAIKRPRLMPVRKAILESPLTRKNTPLPYAPP
jgi:DNA-binding LytR/AlgR family response regulator